MAGAATGKMPVRGASGRWLEVAAVVLAVAVALAQLACRQTAERAPTVERAPAAPAPVPAVQPPVVLYRVRAPSLLATEGVGVLEPELATRTPHHRFEYDGGRLVRVRRLDEQGRPAADDEGVASDEYQWAEGAEHPASVVRRDAFGALVARHTWTAEPGGDALEERRFDRNGREVLPRLRVRTDGRGRPLSVVVMGGGPPPPDWPTAGRAYACADDGEGALVCTTSYRDAQGAPSAEPTGVAAVRETRRADGALLAVEHLDAAGAPRADAFGVATVVHTPDAWGNTVEERRLDARGAPTTDAGGLSIVHYARDREGRVVLRTHHGPDGALRPDAAGVAQVRYTYDARGRLTEKAQLDAAGHLHPNGIGVAREVYEHDDRGLLVRLALHDEAGHLVQKHGVAVFEWTYDAGGRPTELRVRNAEGAHAGDSDGIAIRRWRYDERGNLVAQTFLDAAGDAIDALGPATIRWTLDDRGLVVGEAWEWADPSHSQDGAVRVRYEVDDGGRAVRRETFDIEGNQLESREIDEPAQRALTRPEI